MHRQLGQNFKWNANLSKGSREKRIMPVINVSSRSKCYRDSLCFLAYLYLHKLYSIYSFLILNLLIFSPCYYSVTDTNRRYREFRYIVIYYDIKNNCNTTKYELTIGKFSMSYKIEQNLSRSSDRKDFYRKQHYRSKWNIKLIR